MHTVSKKKLLEKLRKFFAADQQEKIKHLKQIKKVLKKLREKERKLQKKLEQCGDSDKTIVVQQELDIIYAQRMKGVKILQELN